MKTTNAKCPYWHPAVEIRFRGDTEPAEPPPPKDEMSLVDANKQRQMKTYQTAVVVDKCAY
jgi:hypothetical protein